MSARVRVPDLISVSAAVSPDAPALSVKDDTRTYAELWHDVRAAAAGLQALGVRRGDRVLVSLDKRIETVVALFATAAAGAVFVPVNPLLRPAQVGHIATDSSATVLITSRERHAALREALAGSHVESVVIVGTDDVAAPARSWAELVATDAGRLVDTAGTDHDMAAIFYTSGSTGMPKGVVLSHRNIVVGAESVSSYIGNRPDDVILAVLPLSFDAGFSQLTTGFVSGAHVVLLNYLLPGDVVRACERFKVTGLTCVPPLYLQLVNQRWPEDTARRLRYFANTGGRMPRATLDRLRATFSHAKPFLMYGLTEAFRSTYLDPALVDAHPDSIGKAIPNVEVLVARPDGSICEPGEEGELVHCGPLVALGYWNDPERTAARFRPAPGRDPRICTPELAVWSGDSVVRDEAGLLYFVGRKDEMIKTSGYRVSPTEVEEAVYETGLVGDAVALGVPDDTLGQAIVLVASPPGGDAPLDEAALLADLKRRVPPYMMPRTVVSRGAIPRSPNGKFDRALLRAELG